MMMGSYRVECGLPRPGRALSEIQLKPGGEAWGPGRAGRRVRQRISLVSDSRISLSQSPGRLRLGATGAWDHQSAARLLAAKRQPAGCRTSGRALVPALPDTRNTCSIASVSLSPVYVGCCPVILPLPHDRTAAWLAAP